MPFSVPNTTVQIRNMPVGLHRRLKARAAIEGISISDYVLRELRKALDRPKRQQLIERLRAQPPRGLASPPTDVIRAQRGV